MGSAFEKSAFRNKFDQAKTFSDFIGFHVRCSFCSILAWFALSSHVYLYLVAVFGGRDYVARPLSFEVFAFFVFEAYAVVMLYFILRVVWMFCVRDGETSYGRIPGIILASLVIIAEVTLFLFIALGGFIQSLRLLGVPLEVSFCLMDKAFDGQWFMFGTPRLGCEGTLEQFRNTVQSLP
jgi:hypothetical protein